MNISSEAIVSNSDMIKNYKTCRNKAEDFGKIFILKNSQPDAVLFSILEFEKLSVFLEYMDSIEEKDLTKAMESLSKSAIKKTYTIDYYNNEGQLVISLNEIA